MPTPPARRGKPKGVYFSHRQVTLHAVVGGMTLAALGTYGGIDKHDVYMPLTPMFHVNAWGVPYLTTAFGLKQVCPGRYEPEMLVRLIVSESRVWETLRSAQSDEA